MELSAVWRGPRVVMRGSYGEGNFGDDALMVAAHALLRRVFNEGDIAVALGATATADGARHAAKLLPGATFLPYRGGAGAGLEVWGGGTQWCSFPRTVLRSPLPVRIGRRLQSPMRGAAYAVRRLDAKVRTPVASVALGVGVGPFAGEASELVSARELRRMNFVAVRDKVAKDHCDSWGLADVILGADLCFVDPRWCRSSARLVGAAQPTRSIGVIIRDWPHDSDGGSYATPLLRATAFLRRQGFRVEFISYSAKADAEWRSELRRAGEQIVEWDCNSGSLEDFVRLQHGYDCLISSRYHGAIFGALNGTPVICIDVEPKLRIAAETVKGHLWQKPFDETELLALVGWITENRTAEAAGIATAVEAQRSRAAEMAALFLEFLQRAVLSEQPDQAATSPWNSIAVGQPGPPHV